MADIVSELASKCGVSADAVQKGLGTILGLIKSKLPAETFSKISAAVPGSDSMMSAAANLEGQASGGVVEAVKGAFGKLFGGADASAALSKLSQLGMTPDQVTKFIPQVMEFLKSKLPAKVMDQISGMLPVPQEAAH
jgi:hypothetical protein